MNGDWIVALIMAGLAVAVPAFYASRDAFRRRTWELSEEEYAAKVWRYNRTGRCPRCGAMR